jgi:hypothetical protein
MPFLHRVFDLTFVGTMAKKGMISKRKLCIKPTEGGRMLNPTESDRVIPSKMTGKSHGK